MTGVQRSSHTFMKLTFTLMRIFKQLPIIRQTAIQLTYHGRLTPIILFYLYAEAS